MIRKIITLLAFFTITAYAESNNSGAIVIKDLWSSPVSALGQDRPIYMTIENKGATADKLIAIRSSFAEKGEIHQEVENPEGDMVIAVGSVIIGARSTVEFSARKGQYVVLHKIKKLFSEGDNVPVTFVFEKAGEIKVNVSIHARTP